MSSPNLRFAPSPTGPLHVGSIRTAIFNYLYAKSNGGKMLLRIEDTDKERSKNEYVDNILDGLKQMNIKYDGDIVFQSKNLNRHLKSVELLIKNGFAYSDPETDTKNCKQPYRGRTRDDSSFAKIIPGMSVRFKIPNEKSVEVNDMIKGKISFNLNDLEDFVILRSDGTPTYMLSVVSDDLSMKISHVVRGDDHISNTPKQILIYKGLDAKAPEFGHIPLILNTYGKKMSKRDGDSSVDDYIENGYLPEAIFSYLSTLGWSDPKGRECLATEEIVSAFNIKNVGKSQARFDIKKLNFYNLQFMQKLSDKDLLSRIMPFLKKVMNPYEISEKDMEMLQHPLCIQDMRKNDTLVGASEVAYRYIGDISKQLMSDNSLNVIRNNGKTASDVLAFLQQVDESDWPKVEERFQVYLQNSVQKFQDVGPILRSMLIGITDTIPVFHITTVFGKERSISNMTKALEILLKL